MVQPTKHCFDPYEDPATIWVCSGPPACWLEDDNAIIAMQAGCLKCRRIIMEPDGSETVIEPGGTA